MSDESPTKEKAFEFPMMPIFGVDLGRELGSIDSRLTRVENDIIEVKRDIKAVDGRVDKCLVAINRLDERTKNLESKFNLSIGLSGGILIAVLAGIVLQILLK